MTKTASIINLVIIGIAIVLVISIKTTKIADQFNNTGMNMGPNMGIRNPYNVYQSGNWESQNLSYPNGPNGPVDYRVPLQYMPGPDYQVPDPTNGWPNSNLNKMPLLSEYQMYPKAPYSSDQGSACSDEEQCGAMGTCVNGVCQVKEYNGSVFNIQI